MMIGTTNTYVVLPNFNFNVYSVGAGWIDVGMYNFLDYHIT